MKTFFRFSPSPKRPPGEQPVPSSETESQTHAVSCQDQSFDEALTSSTTVKPYEKSRARVRADRAPRMKSWGRRGKLFLSRNLQSSTREEMRRKTKTGAGVQCTKKLLEAIAERFPKLKKVSSVRQNGKISQVNTDGPGTIVERLDTKGSNGEPVKCLTDEEVRAFALQRAESCARNRDLSAKHGCKFKR